ncbi:MAG: class I SAM-dependent methyltransferase, partial [Flavobacteriaceae bacterium]|nr:class I SAM-dependent methyltransferase [Flavobacteriaceae bacterium]
ALALGNNEALVTSVEGCKNTLKVANSLLEKYNINNVRLQNDLFDNFLRKNLSPYDLVYIDGNHEKTKTLEYFDLLLPLTHSDSCIIFDDIHWSQGMYEAWTQISNHPKVTVSIDSFWWGMVFFSNKQEKQHFYIRL